MNYLKLLPMFMAAVLTAVIPLIAQGGHLTAAEDVNLILAVLGAAAVFTAPNLPDATYVKAVLAALTAGATLLASVIPAGGFGMVSPIEWFQIILAILGALGAAILPHPPHRV